jgi:hypothetical protein
MAPKKRIRSLCLGARLALFAVAGTAGGTRVAHAAPPDPSPAESWPVDKVDPEHGAPTPEQMAKQPLQAGYFLMDVAALGDAALKEQRYADAVKFFGVLARLVPDRSVSFARLCESYQGLGQRENAVRSCRDALGREGATVADSVRYVGLVLGSDGELGAVDRADVEAVLAHLHDEHADVATVSGLECQLAVKIDDIGRLTACSTQLAKLAPSEPRTTVFLWTLAMRRGDRARAAELIVQAHLVGVDSTLLAEMASQTKALRFAWWTNHTRAWALLGFGVLAAFTFAVLRLRARRANAEPVLGIVARM